MLPPWGVLVTIPRLVGATARGESTGCCETTVPARKDRRFIGFMPVMPNSLLVPGTPEQAKLAKPFSVTYSGAHLTSRVAEREVEDGCGQWALGMQVRVWERRRSCRRLGCTTRKR